MSGAATWPARPALRPQESRFAYADAITWFARALGTARSGNPAAAPADIAKLAELRDRLRQANDQYWTEQVDIQWQVASAFLLRAEHKPDEALGVLSAAADAEDRTEKSMVHARTAGAPARQLFGAMLLERGRARDALAAFETALVKEPIRYNGLAGAARAAEALRRHGEGQDLLREVLLALVTGSNANRPDVGDGPSLPGGL